MTLFHLFFSTDEELLTKPHTTHDLRGSMKFELLRCSAKIPTMMSSTTAPDAGGAGNTADIPPPLPPVLPPIMATATAASSVAAAQAHHDPIDNHNAIINANASFPEEEEQQLVEAPTANNTSSSVINFEGIMTELQNFQRENEGSLAIPSSHPALMRILDSLTNTGLEKLAAKRWEDQLLALTSYKNRYGTCDVALNHPLEPWTTEQRNQYRQYEQQELLLPNNNNNPLTTERYDKLKNIGITINRWEKRLTELKAYKIEHGHCDVPLDHPSGLGIWVSTQRENAHWHPGEMPKERVASLDAVGFNWNRWGHTRTKTRQDAWETQFVKLTEYIRVNGHSNISQHDKEHGKLGKWVKNQRYEYRKFMNKGLGPSRLGRDRIEKLESINFQWRLRPEIIPWETRFQNLKEFKLQHGHCRVPYDHSELGKWAKYQRDNYGAFMKLKPCKMTQKKFDLLKELGFEESLDENIDNYVGEVAAESDVPEEQKKKRAATNGNGRSKTDEAEFLAGVEGGDIAHPNNMFPEHFYPGMGTFENAPQRQGQEGYNGYVQHPAYQQGYGGHSNY